MTLPDRPIRGSSGADQGRPRPTWFHSGASGVVSGAGRIRGQPELQIRRSKADAHPGSIRIRCRSETHPVWLRCGSGAASGTGAHVAPGGSPHIARRLAGPCAAQEGVPSAQHLAGHVIAEAQLLENLVVDGLRAVYPGELAARADARANVLGVLLPRLLLLLLLGWGRSANPLGRTSEVLFASPGSGLRYLGRRKFRGNAVPVPPAIASSG